jgi:hypothetical protein
LNRISSTDIQVLPNHFLEENATGLGAVENLGEGELSLENPTRSSVVAKVIFVVLMSGAESST